jgi:hypothetical protein
MATKPASSKKTVTSATETSAASAAARTAKTAAKPAAKASTPRVRTVKHKAAAASAVETVAVETPVTAPALSAHEEISQIAYGYWVSRGCTDGDPAQDWLRAEAEYRQRFAV